jgi:hypothetical protein
LAELAAIEKLFERLLDKARVAQPVLASLFRSGQARAQVSTHNVVQHGFFRIAPLVDPGRSRFIERTWVT